MSEINIVDIKEQIGPLAGPYFKRLVTYHREKDWHTGKSIPADVARFTCNILRTMNLEEPSMEQCPEKFAAAALAAFGVPAPELPVGDASELFQERARFHEFNRVGP